MRSLLLLVWAIAGLLDATTTSGYVPVLSKAAGAFASIAHAWTADAALITLKGDSFGLLPGLHRDQSNNGFDWQATYDAFGRRVRTVQKPVTNGTPGNPPLTIDSYYDPEVEFLELGVAVNSTTAVTGANNGPRTWKMYGPDLNGVYGGLQGIGGLLGTVLESSGALTPLVTDAFGNTIATAAGGNFTWTAPEIGGYGLLPGSTAKLLDGSTPLAQTIAWRSHRLDPTGYYYLGARYYDPTGGRFLSPDPLGHGRSVSLYDYAGGDPVNGLDPDGRCDVTKLSASVGGTMGLTGEQNSYPPGIPSDKEILENWRKMSDDGFVPIRGLMDRTEGLLSAYIGPESTYLLLRSPLSPFTAPGSPLETVQLTDNVSMPIINEGYHGIYAFRSGDYGQAGLHLTGSATLTLLLAVPEADGAFMAAEGVEAQGGTYLLRDAETGQVMRTGRTNDLLRRQAEHARDPVLKDFEFEPVHRTDVYEEQRGLEQLLHETHNPPLNKIQPISPTNPRLQEYLDAARRFLNNQ